MSIYRIERSQVPPVSVDVDDIVSYALKYAVLGTLIHKIWIKKRLQTIFDYRSSALKRRSGSTPGSTAGGEPPAGSEADNSMFGILR
jgi:hypothetical protein